MMALPDIELQKPQTIDTIVQNFNNAQKNYTQLSSFEQEFYYWVNYSRINPKRFFDSVVYPASLKFDQFRGENFKSLQKDLFNTTSLPLLSLNNSLITIAREQSLDITTHNSNPSHTSTNGESFSERFKKTGLTVCGGENISYGSGDVLLALILLYLDIGISDLGHRKALLNPNFSLTGIGASNFKNGYFFLVEDFACTQK